MRRTRITVAIALTLGATACGSAHTEEWRKPTTQASVESDDGADDGIGGETPVQFFRTDGGPDIDPGLLDAGSGFPVPLELDASTVPPSPPLGGSDGGRFF